jgi:hypothetical protein
MNAVVLGSIALGILSVFIRPEGVPLAHMVTDLPAKQGTGLLFWRPCWPCSPHGRIASPARRSVSDHRADRGYFA